MTVTCDEADQMLLDHEDNDNDMPDDEMDEDAPWADHDFTQEPCFVYDGTCDMVHPQVTEDFLYELGYYSCVFEQGICRYEDGD
jgi:hypothetical protein